MKDLRIRLAGGDEVSAGFASMMKDKDWSGQKVAMFILKQYFTKPVEQAKEVKESPKRDYETNEDHIIDWVIKRYHELMPHGAKLSAKGIVRDKVENRIKAMLKQDDFKTGDQWQEYFNLILASDWLMGRSGDWKASLTWLLGPKNIVKVLGGEYSSHTATVGTKTKSEVIDDKNKEACMTFVERKREQLRLEGKA